jgi:hypothetical protein
MMIGQFGIVTAELARREDVERYPERRRERFLSPTELQRLGQALTTAGVSASETIYSMLRSGSCF